MKNEMLNVENASKTFSPARKATSPSVVQIWGVYLFSLYSLTDTVLSTLYIFTLSTFIFVALGNTNITSIL